MSDKPEKMQVFNRKISDNIRVAIKQPLPEETHRDRGVFAPTRAVRSEFSATYIEAAKSKLTKPLEWRQDMADTSRNLKDAVDASSQYFEKLSDDSALAVREAEEVLGALPDVAIGKRILINSILSPNDMISKELTYGAATKMFGDVTPLLLDVVRDHFDNVYKIKDKLGEMLEKALFLEGSYISVALPESSIDDAINSNLVISKESWSATTESMNNPLSLLGSVESATYTHGEEQVAVTDLLGVTVTDNYEVFKLPHVNKRALSDAVASRFGPRMRSVKDKKNKVKSNNHNGLVSIDSIDTSDLYPERTQVTVNMLSLKTLDDLEEIHEESVGHPIVINVPIEAFIPVTVPGQPSSHVGGFILLDKSGNPVVKRAGVDQYRDLNTRYQASYNEISSGLIAASFDRNLMHDSSALTNGPVDVDTSAKLYALLLEEELMKRLRLGGFGEDISLGMLNNISRIMLSRACQRMETKVIFVPKQLYSFLAFDYKDTGLGRSLLERNKTISSLRMVQELADSLANIRNAIDHKELTINVDPDDPNPWKTAMEVLHNVQRSTRLGSPIGLINMSSIADSFQEHGWNVKVAGHEAMPDMSVDFNQTTRNFSKPDSDYADRLRNQMFLSMGLSPDSISGVFGSEFATNVVSSNVFLAQDALEKQSIFASFLSDFVIKYVTNSGVLMDKLEEVVQQNHTKIRLKNIKKVDYRLVAQVFVNNIQISLPKPDLAKFDMQKTALQSYADILDTLLPYYISEEAMTQEQFGEYTAEVVSDAIQAIKDACMRNFAAQMNIAPELNKMLYQQPDEIQDLSMLHVQDDHLNSMLPKLQDFMARAYKRRLKADRLNLKIRELLDEKYGSEEEDRGDDYGSSEDYGDEDYDDSDSESGDGYDDDEVDTDDLADDDFGELDDNPDNDDVSDTFDEMEDMLDSLESKNIKPALESKTSKTSKKRKRPMKSLARRQPFDDLPESVRKVIASDPKALAWLLNRK